MLVGRQATQKRKRCIPISGRRIKRNAGRHRSGNVGWVPEMVVRQPRGCNTSGEARRPFVRKTLHEPLPPPPIHARNFLAIGQLPRCVRCILKIPACSLTLPGIVKRRRQGRRPPRPLKLIVLRLKLRTMQHEAECRSVLATPKRLFGHCGHCLSIARANLQTMRPSAKGHLIKALFRRDLRNAAPCRAVSRINLNCLLESINGCCAIAEYSRRAS